jgi:hypothetical protein
LVDAEDIDSALQAVKAAGAKFSVTVSFVPGSHIYFVATRMATRWRFGMSYAHQLIPRRPNQSVGRTATRIVSTRRVARVLLMSFTCALGRRPSRCSR